MEQKKKGPGRPPKKPSEPRPVSKPEHEAVLAAWREMMIAGNKRDAAASDAARKKIEAILNKVQGK